MTVPKIGYVVKRYPRYSETFIVNEILAHEEAGLDVEIFALRASEDTHFQGIIARVRSPVSYLSSPGKARELWAEIQCAAALLPGFWPGLAAGAGADVRDIQHALQLARLARSRGVTHLHAHFATSAAAVARLAAHLAGVPYTLTAHAKDIFHETVEPDVLREKLLDAGATITVSDFNVAYLRAKFGSAASSVERVYNGLDLSEFRYEDPTDRLPQILAVGRLVEKKGFSDLVDALAILKGQGCSFRSAIIGEGPLESALKEQVARLGLENLVFMVGPCPRHEVMEQVQASAVFAAPCIVGLDGNRDGLPTVLLEAMALGTPCVSTAVTGIPEVISHGKTGLMVPQSDPGALAAALRRLLVDRSLRVRLARNARDRIEAEFDVHRNSAVLRSIFARCRTGYNSHQPRTPELAEVS